MSFLNFGQTIGVLLVADEENVRANSLDSLLMLQMFGLLPAYTKTFFQTCSLLFLIKSIK
jgi:hypothetical protein